MNVREHVALLDDRLDGLSVSRRLVTSLGFDPPSIELAVHDPGLGHAPVRPALPFQFDIEPWRQEDSAPSASPSMILRGRAVVSNVLNVMLPMPSTSFAFTLALPPREAEEIYYRDPVANAQQAAADAPPAWFALGPTSPPHAAVRAEIERIFMLPGARTPDGQAQVTFTGRVMGHRLTRRSDRYAEPGSGSWSLVRIVDPGDGWIALDLSAGWGEFFSAGRDEATTMFGRHLARALG